MWEKLEPILRKVCDDKEYLFGIRSLLPTEDNKKELFEAIKAGLVAKDADEIEPQGEMGGFPGMGGEEDGAGGPDLPHAGRGGEVGDKPPRLPESRHRLQDP